MKLTNKYLSTLIFLLFLLGLAAALIAVKFPQELRRRAAVEGGTASLTLDTTNSQLNLNLGSEVIDGLQVVAEVTGNIPADLTFTPATIPGLELVENTIANNVFTLVFVTVDPLTPFHPEQTVILGEFTFTAPDSSSFTIAFDPVDTLVTQNQTAQDILDIPDPVTYNFSTGASPSPSPSASPSTPPAPEGENVSPIIRTKVLRPSRANTTYQTLISGYDPNPYEQLTMTISDLPGSLSYSCDSIAAGFGRPIIRCLVSGTTPGSGEYNPVVTLADGRGLQTQRILSWTVSEETSNNSLRFATQSLPAGETSQAYSAVIIGLNLAPLSRATLIIDNLPSSLTATCRSSHLLLLSYARCDLSGTAPEQDTDITAKLSNNLGQSIEKTYPLSIK